MILAELSPAHECKHVKLFIRNERKRETFDKVYIIRWTGAKEYGRNDSEN